MAHTTTGTQGEVGTGNEPIDMQVCIENCTDTHQICLETIQHCLGKGGKHASADHIRLLSDCAQICETSADFMTRESSFHNVVCRACAEICRACADSCRQLGGIEMEACAEACEGCAGSCEAMASVHSH